MKLNLIVLMSRFASTSSNIISMIIKKHFATIYADDNEIIIDDVNNEIRKEKINKNDAIDGDILTIMI